MTRPVLLAALGAAGLLYVYFVPPAESGWYPPCPFHSLTGLHCPGCGTGRGLHLLLHGDLAGAMAMNPVSILALPFLAYGLWRTWQHERTGRPLPRLLSSSRFGWALMAALVAFWVLRNLPWPPFTWLAPG